MKKIVLACSLVLLTAHYTQAQLCTGSLGDPVVNITFGSGNNPGPSLKAAATSYQYITTDCPSDGSYTVRNTTFGCSGGTWHNIGTDHTPGDNNGYFMLINASYQPGDFYVETVSGLCANTTYEFAAWVANILVPSACGGAGIAPNITFNIETTGGTVLGTYNTGNIPAQNSLEWKQYGMFFTTPASTTQVVIRMTNNAPGGCGNDLAVDDITFRPCGPEVNAVVTSNSSPTISLCEGDPSVFDLSATVSSGYNSPAYQWQVSTDSATWTDITGATTDSYQRTPTDPGTYYYRMSVAASTNIDITGCRVASNVITITVNELPDATITTNSPVCVDQTLMLTTGSGAQYAWTGPDGFTATTADIARSPAVVQYSGSYGVTVTSAAGCIDQATAQVTVNPNPTATVANVSAICEGAAATLQASGGTSYAWTPAASLSDAGIANPQASPADTTLYTVVVTNEYGCTDTAEVLLPVWKKPEANAGENLITRAGVPVTLDGTAAGTDITYYWTPAQYLSATDVLNPVASPPSDITYTLQVESTHGCGISTDDVFVRVYEEIKIPNAFSPNNDGINDTWVIKALNTYPQSKLQVFNRQGQVVFESKGYTAPWDGKLNGKVLPMGTYYYVIDLKEGNLPKLSGWIYLSK